MLRRTGLRLALCQALVLCVPKTGHAIEEQPKAQASPSATEDLSQPSTTRSADALLSSLNPQGVVSLVTEVLERNPAIARAERLALAAEARVPQVGALPDPVAALSLFVLPAETRTGPQLFSASLQQELPWFGKLAAQERSAVLSAAAARADVEALRLEKLTETRRLVVELSFLQAYEAVVEAERRALVRYETAAQARYAAGTGLQQGIVRIQAQITRSNTRLLEIAERRSALTAELNRLRDRPSATLVAHQELSELDEPIFDTEALLRVAHSSRPEIGAATARIASASELVNVARLGFRPDVTVGASYTAVGSRDDVAARFDPPEDESDDIFTLTGSLKLPVRRGKLEAAVEEATAHRWAAEENKRAILAQIASEIGDLTTRMPLLWEHLSLLDRVLLRQAREALRSAETAYSTGRLNAVDLLDAEVVLLEVEIAAARTRADLAVAHAQLERSVGRPVDRWRTKR